MMLIKDTTKKMLIKMTAARNRSRSANYLNFLRLHFIHLLMKKWMPCDIFTPLNKYPRDLGIYLSEQKLYYHLSPTTVI